MRHAMVENGKVVNIIEADESFAKTIGAIPVGDIGVGIGDDYVNGRFTIRTADYVLVEVDPLNIVPDPEPLSLEEKYDLLAGENKLLKAQVQAQTDRSVFIEDVIAEMAMQVYV